MRPFNPALASRFVFLLFLCAMAGCQRQSGDEVSGDPATIDDYVALVGQNPDEIESAFQRIRGDWQEGSLTMVLDCMRFAKDTKVKFEIPKLLQEKEGIRDFKEPQKLLKKVWNKEYKPHPDYVAFKSKLYGRLDPDFEEYFDPSFPTTIRWDEIRWGGVRRDGIPPLDHPKMMSVEEATYLDDSNVVFGVYLNGEAHCYPKRILAWHEMVKDKVGGVEINGVYCTLCGSVIVYFPEFEGQHYELGTSGFLYRSNKLMYDHKTKSLWNTIEGEPVVGLLVGKGIKLKRHHVVTTTWGSWKAAHPDTKVLSLETGHRRDYGEGVAYNDYFSKDSLYFEVPKSDRRLKNKDEVLALRFDDTPEEQLAISADFLKSNPVYHDQLGQHEFVVLTDASGANRVYQAKPGQFTSLEGDQLKDKDGAVWKVNELCLENADGEKLERLPAHRAFWFGWHAVYNDTRLVK